MTTRTRPSSVFLPPVGIAGLAAGTLRLQDLHEIRLLLRGDSVVDWHRLNLTGPEDVRRLLRVNSIDVDNPGDVQRLEDLRHRAAQYIGDTLGVRLDAHVASGCSALELPLLASGASRLQRHACVLLKVMHIIYHLDARELRTMLSIPEHSLYELVEQSVMSMFDELRANGVAVVEFAWSRKTPESLITKLLVKRETSAARIFDRLRFRVIVERHQDLLPTLHLMLTRFIPFNYVVPGQTVNSVIDPQSLSQQLAEHGEVVTVPSPTAAMTNEFSSSGYRVLNFIADLPVRVDALLRENERAAGNVVFVLAEFQVIDRAQASANEQGDSSHDLYKHRQHQRVRERLLRGPRNHAAAPPAATDNSDE